MSGHYYDQKIKYSTDDHVYSCHEYNLDIKSRTIYLFGETSYISHETESEPGVEYSMANRFIKNLNILQKTSTDPILIVMKTCGGDWVEGMAIYDAIISCPNKVSILAYGAARSMSSIILLAADRRVLTPHCKYMYHQGTFSFDGTVKQFETEMTELEECNEIMMGIYIEAMKKSPKSKFKRKSREFLKNYLMENMNKKEEVYLNAKQTIDHGFADEIYGITIPYCSNSLTA